MEKGVVFKVDNVDHEDHVVHDIDDNLIESIVMLTKNFNKVMRRLDRTRIILVLKTINN